jgi:hypothetical protein
MPKIPRLDSILKNVEVEQDITRVTIKYQSRSEEKVSGNKTLRQVFEDVGNKFRSTWSRNETSLNPMIDGIDVNDNAIGGFGPQTI